MKKEKNDKVVTTWGHKLFTALGIILCILLLPILIVNIVLIVKGVLNDAVPPSVLGRTPLVVLSGSMDDGSRNAIQIGDLIVANKTDAENLKINDVVSFMEGKYAVTHRIVAVNKAEDGSVTYTTRGDANNADDLGQLDPKDVIGKYSFKIDGAGNFVLFMQSPPGILCFVGIPLLLFILYDIIRRNRMRKTDKIRQEELEKELELLRNSAAEPEKEPEPKPEEPKTETPPEVKPEEQKTEPEEEPEKSETPPAVKVKTQPAPKKAAVVKIKGKKPTNTKRN